MHDPKKFFNSKRAKDDVAPTASTQQPKEGFLISET